MKRTLAFVLSIVMIVSLIPAMSAYAWNKPATFPNGEYGNAAGSPHTLVPLWDNPQFIPDQNSIGRDWKDHMAPFTFDVNKYAEGKVTGKLPAMGWNSWNVFGQNNSETTTKAIADSFIRLGMDKVGWQYIVLDDGCYTNTRDANQEIQAHPTRFPNGFKSLADYIHSLGLKMGMYNDVGITCCLGANYTAMWGREDIDAMYYAKMGIDYLKIDFCANPWVLSSANSNATVTIASPNIKAIRILDSLSNNLTEIRALDGTIGTGDMIVPGLGTSVRTFNDTHEIPGYVNNLTDSRIQDGGTSGDLTFKYKPAASDEYYIQVYYSSTSLGATRSPDDSARWLQMDINGERVFDNKLPTTSAAGDTASSALNWTWSAPIKVSLNGDNDNSIRLYCTRRSETGMEEYYAFWDGMNKAKEVYKDWDPIYALCEWNDSQGAKWAWKYGNSWRTTKDISSSWSSMRNIYNWNVVMDNYAGLDKGWNDPDMLEVGNTGNFARTEFSANESHFNLWSMMNAPLMLGIDLRTVEVGDDMHRIITNKDIIALNQDPLGVQAKRILNKTATESVDPRNYSTTVEHDDVLAKPLANNDVAIIIANFGNDTTTPRTTSITIDEIVNGTAQWGVGIGSQMVDKDKFLAADFYKVVDLGAKSKSTFIIAKDEPISVDLVARASKTFRISAVSGTGAELNLDDDGNIVSEYFIDGKDCDKALLLLAVYDEKGALQDVIMDDQTIGSGMFYFTLKTKEPPKANWIVKGFIWDGDSFVPVCERSVYLK